VGETESRTNKPVGQGKGPFLGIVYTQDHLCLHKLMFWAHLDFISTTIFSVLKDSDRKLGGLVSTSPLKNLWQQTHYSYRRQLNWRSCVAPVQNSFPNPYSPAPFLGSGFPLSPKFDPPHFIMQSNLAFFPSTLPQAYLCIAKDSLMFPQNKGPFMQDRVIGRDSVISFFFLSSSRCMEIYSPCTGRMKWPQCGF
jgi:hypothetical protein